MFGKLKLMSIATLLAFVSGAFAADVKPTGTLPVVYINTKGSKPIGFCRPSILFLLEEQTVF